MKFKSISVAEKMKVLNKVEVHGMAKIAAVTEVKLLKKSRITKNPTPAKFDGLLKLTVAVVSVMHNYENAVQGRIDKNGVDFSFEASASTVSGVDAKSENGIFRQGLKDANQKYLRVYYNMAPIEKTITHYLTPDGELVVPTEQEIEEFFPVKSESKKQADAGLDEEQQVVVREYKLENVIYFKKGNVSFSQFSDAHVLFKTIESL